MRTVICLAADEEGAQRASPDLTRRLDEILATTSAHVLIAGPGAPGLAAPFGPRVLSVDDASAIRSLETAVHEGFDRVVELGAAFSPRHVPDVLDALETADVVIGSRFVRGGALETGSTRRRVASRAANLGASIVLGAPFSDCTSTLVGFRRYVLEAIELDTIRAEGPALALELKMRAYRLGFSIAEVPVVAREASKLSRTLVVGLMRRVVDLRLRDAP